jgi:hypothetical protein
MLRASKERAFFSCDAVWQLLAGSSTLPDFSSGPPDLRDVCVIGLPPAINMSHESPDRDAIRSLIAANLGEVPLFNDATPSAARLLAWARALPRKETTEAMQVLLTTVEQFLWTCMQNYKVRLNPSDSQN